MGVIASGGVAVVNEDVVGSLADHPRGAGRGVAAGVAGAARRERAYRGDRPSVDVAGRTLLLVDDGLATGTTMRAAIAALRRLRPSRVIAAVPTAAPATCEEIRAEADDCICAMTPEQRSTPSASGTTTSPRRPTRKSAALLARDDGPVSPN